MEYFRENRGYQVVIGRKGGGESGNWIIEEQGRDVPADSHAVFLPRINNANYSIKFIGENLDTSFTEIFTRETFLKFGWPNLITSFHDDLKTHGMNAGGLPGLIAEKVK